jgi:phosphoglucosamine mutase
MRRFFGTDGVRGKAGVYPLTAEFVLKLGQAAAKIFQNGNKKHSIVIGKDTRMSGYIFEYAIVSGLCSRGVNAILVGVLPTPAVAYLIKSLRADAGIVISASHNPYNDNGIKFFNSSGYKLSDELEEEMENYLDKVDDYSPDLIGKAYRIDTAIWRYVEYVKTTFDKDVDLKGLKIVVDCANGATYKVAPLALSELGAELVVINNKPDGCNINANCGSIHPEMAAAEVIKHKANLGITFDGDGDRVIFIDENGRIINGDFILGICARYMNELGKLNRSSIVATVMSNLGLSLTLKKYGINVLSCPVGDRYVVDTMIKDGLNLGGEQSGHIVFLDYNSTGDGLISALQLLKILVKKNVPLSHLADDIELLPQIHKNLKVNKRVSVNELKETNKLLNYIKNELGDGGRVFLRYSGTEKILRIMLEGSNEDKLNIFDGNILDVAKKEIENFIEV